MIETIVAALLPIVVTLVLVFFAGWHHDFEADQAAVLNRMVMLYALPLTLSMVGGYILVFVLTRYVFLRSAKIAALQALAIAGPAVPFYIVP